MSIHDRLKELGITLPEPMKAVANYVPYVITGNLISISGQISMRSDGTAIEGKCPIDVSIEQAVAAARLCAINIIAQLNDALEGDLDRVTRIVRLGGFVNSAPDFSDHPVVINGASDLMVEVFGDKGRHSRAAVGVAALPRGVTVEVDALVEIA